MLHPSKPPARRRRFLTPPLVLALSYLLFSVTWILVTDDLASRWANQPARYNQLQHVKGLLFVFSSALLIFLLTRYFYGHLRLRYRENKALLARYDLLHRATQEAIIDFDFKTNCAMVNDAMMQLLQSDTHEIWDFRTHYLRRVHPADRQRVASQLEHLEEHGEMWLGRFKFRAGSRGYRDMRAQGYLMREAGSDKPLRMVFAMSDETEVLDTRAQLLYTQMQAKQEQARSVIAAEERERERWAHELHDNVCQLLTAAGLTLAQTETADPVRNRAKKLVDQSLNEIRQLSAAIRPPEFAEDTLEEAIVTLIANIRRLVDLDVRLNMEQAIEDRLSGEQKLMIYRIVQEQLNNVLKYAGATTVTLSITTNAEQEVELELSDNGKGFDPGQLSTGIGLKNIRSRLQAFSGTMEVRSQPGMGCTLSASFPLPQ